MKKVPQSRCLRILEAGVCTLQQIQQLESMGVHGVIVGDALLDEFYPGKRLAQILAGIEVVKKPVKTKGRQEPQQPSTAKGSRPAKAAAGTAEGEKQKTGGTAQAGKAHSTTQSPQPARKGKKEFPMEHINQPDETGMPPVEQPADAVPAVKKPAAKKAAPKKAAAPKKPAAKKAAPKKAAKK